MLQRGGHIVGSERHATRPEAFNHARKFIDLGRSDFVCRREDGARESLRESGNVRILGVAFLCPAVKGLDLAARDRHVRVAAQELRETSQTEMSAVHRARQPESLLGNLRIPIMRLIESNDEPSALILEPGRGHIDIINLPLDIDGKLVVDLYSVCKGLAEFPEACRKRIDERINIIRRKLREQIVE